MADAVELASGAKNHRLLVVRCTNYQTAALHLRAPIVLTHLVVATYLTASDNLAP